MPIRLFLENLDKWRNAFANRQFDDCRRSVEEIAFLGQMLSADPEFQRLFAPYESTCGNATVDDALRCLRAFLHTLTDAAEPGRYRANEVPR